MKKFFVLLVLLLTVPLNVIAQEEKQVIKGLTIRPAIAEVVVEPGQKTTGSILVENNADIPLPVAIDARSLIFAENEIEVSRAKEIDASAWISFDEAFHIFEVGEQTEINYAVEAPLNATPGGHYALIGFQVVAEQLSIEDQQTLIIPEVAATLFATVPGDIVEEAEVDVSSIAPSWVMKGDTIEFKFGINNKSNVHILPSPKLSIIGENGKIKEFNFQPQLILPGVQKEFTAEWLTNVPYGNYDVQVEFIYGNNSIAASSERVSFRVIPEIIQIALIVLLILVLILVFITRKNIPRAFNILRGKHVNRKHSYKTEHEDDSFMTNEQLIKDTPRNKTSHSQKSKIAGKIATTQHAKIDKLIPTPIYSKPDPKAKIKNKPEEKLQTNEKLSKITETSSSTIIREDKTKKAPKNSAKKSRSTKNKPKKVKIKIN